MSWANGDNSANGNSIIGNKANGNGAISDGASAGGDSANGVTTGGNNANVNGKSGVCAGGSNAGAAPGNPGPQGERAAAAPVPAISAPVAAPCAAPAASPCALFLPARREHIPGIHEIEKLSFATPWSAESFEREFDDDLARYFVALRDGAVIGYCGYWSVAGEAHVTNVAVHPSHRRRHVGIGLMRRMLRDIADSGIGHITLEAREDNAAAISMYEQLGFSRSGLRKNYYAKERKNAIIMWKHA
ncbi:MAG: ribosomal protein S18-alanine N-acetyltransferase [Clostridiales bacterium]|jgi:ribosomal-protein-alanine N-acetyltransferase|nr:ribosomal protein S18-alanine N-acetyltransferase [Clostridiales bacterium]